MEAAAARLTCRTERAMRGICASSGLSGGHITTTIRGGVASWRYYDADETKTEIRWGSIGKTRRMTTGNSRKIERKGQRCSSRLGSMTNCDRRASSRPYCNTQADQLGTGGIWQRGKELRCGGGNLPRLRNTTVVASALVWCCCVDAKSG